MVERSTPSLPGIVTLTLVVVGLSGAFWQWNQSSSEYASVAEGTIQEIEYVRRGATANLPIIDATFEADGTEYQISYASHGATDSTVGDPVTVRYQPGDPETAVPAAAVAAETARHRSFAVFSALVGVIAILAAVAAKVEADNRSPSRTGIPQAMTAG